MRKACRSLVWIPILAVFVACDDDQPQEPPSVEPGSVFRDWTIHSLANDPAFDSLLTSDSQEGGVVDVVEALGGLVVRPPGIGPDATAEVFSNETGHTFWISAQAPTPHGLAAPDSLIGSAVSLDHALRFRKDAEDASLRFIITQVQLEAIDANVVLPTHDECPWWVRGVLVEFAGECAQLMKGEIEATYYAYTDPTRTEPPEAFYFASATAKLFGWGVEWYPDVYTGSLSVDPLFRASDFEFEMDTDGTGRHPRIRLGAPVPIDIPLESVDAGEAFEVVFKVRASVRNRRQRESYLAAYFRDPATSDGLTVEYDGLTMLEAPDEIREAVWTPAAAPPCGANGAAGAGGTIAFDSATFLDAEWPGGNAAIVITRTGGGDGPASVVFATSGGTATAGTDYESVTTLVLFADGEEGRRVVPVPILTDNVEEADETVVLSLASPGGCATLGLADAELKILDDDQPPPAAYTVGGTVTGLEGTGLRLRNIASVVAITSDGPFAFPGEYPPGSAYDVTVDQQPSDPLQACTVTNGQGVVAGEDVTDILVTCETPTASGGLDPDFGTGGIVAMEIGPNSDDRFAAAVALQPDGKVLVLGRTTLIRYHADGTLDTGFGTNGEVEVSFGTGDARLYDVAVQPDGRILVAGGTVDNVNLPADDDFGLARFEADGTPDASFGAGGVVTTDFDGRIDGAYEVLVAPDGSIVLTGVALEAATIDFDFAVARYTSAGVPDPTFGPDGDGTATVSIGGRSDEGYAAALQSDGGIVVVGRAADSGGDDPDIGIARLDTNGILDPDFGDDGIVWVTTEDTAEWALDVVVDANDRILVAGRSEAAAFVARYGATGNPDGGFGTAGMFVDDVLFGANGIALDDAGRILIVGTADGDFGVVRLRDGGTFDTDFGVNGDGLVPVDFFGDPDEASDVVIQPDGRIIVVGVIQNGLQRFVGLARVLP